MAVKEIAVAVKEVAVAAKLVAVLDCPTMGDRCVEYLVPGPPEGPRSRSSLA